MPRIPLRLVFCLLPAASLSPVKAEEISLDAYLKDVLANNDSIQASKSNLEAGELRQDSADIVFSPQFFSQAAHTLDKKEPTNPFAGTKTEATSLSVGVQKVWETGLQSKLSYTLTRVDLEFPHVSPAITLPVTLDNPLNPGTPFSTVANFPNPLIYAFPASQFSEARTQLELVQPLLKNSKGRDFQLARESSQTKIAMQKSAETYKIKTMVAQAEYVYWQLALAQEAVRTQERSLERFKRLKAWAQRRANMQLGDRADVLQADSGVRLRSYELEQAKKDRNSAERAFNTLRGKSGDRIEGSLATISAPDLEKKPKLEGGVKRLDVEVARGQQRLSEIEVEQSREKFSSQLDLFGTVALNTLEDETDDALRNSFDSDHPTYIVGLKFSTPLDRDLIDRERGGLVRSSQAAQYEVEQRTFAAQQDWDDLQRQLEEAQMRLGLAQSLERAQKEKLEYEKDRLEIGRTTTYQIIMFEQDYASSQLATIKAKADILGILARLKSFGDSL